jgi:hypothetical protein
MIFFLLVLYQVKHFICDYPLQGRYMLGKFLPYPDFIKPLLAHAAVHGVATLAIALFYKSFGLAICLGLLDMGVHFMVDRIKASPGLLGRFKPLSASSYKMALNMSLGLTIFDGKPMKELSGQMMKEYKYFGKKDLRGNTFFWWSLGADQAAHHLTHYFIIWMLM